MPPRKKKNLATEAPEIVVEAVQSPLLEDAVTFTVPAAHEWGQLFSEVTDAVGEVAMAGEDGETPTLHVAPSTVDAVAVEAVVAAHVPVAHYGYTEDQKHLHNIALKVKLGQSLSPEESADQFRALFALQDGTLAPCECSVTLS